MRIPFPDDRVEINETDFSVLYCLWEDGPLWKMELSRRINEGRADRELLLDIRGSISKQAVGRRVDGLHTDGLIEKQMVHTAVGNTERFVMAYDLTDRGREQLRRAVVDILAATVTACLRDQELAECGDIDRYLELYSDLVEPADSLLDAVEGAL